MASAGQAFAQENTGSLHGTVVDDTGRAIALAQVVVRPFDGGGDGFDLETGGDGTYGLSDLSGGLYTVTAGTGDLSSDLFRVRVRPGRTVEVHFRLSPGRRDASWLTELGEREAATRSFAAGLVASRAGDHPTAIELFTRAVERQPDCAACHYNLAVAYVELERFDHAERAFTRVLELTPNYAAAYYGLSSVYTRLGRVTDATAARGEATRLALAGLAAHHQRLQEALEHGIATLNTGDRAGARVHFERLVREDASFAPPHYWLAVILLDANDPARAATAYRRYLLLDGDGEHADKARAALSSLGR